jgi:hypothetical protein
MKHKHTRFHLPRTQVQPILFFELRALCHLDWVIQIADLTHPRLRSIVPTSLAVGITQIQAGSVVQACVLEAIPLGDNMRDCNRRPCVLVQVGGRREGVSGSHHDYVVMLNGVVNQIALQLTLDPPKSRQSSSLRPQADGQDAHVRTYR